MGNPYGISKVEDHDGSNFIVRSSLTRYNSKSRAEAYSIKAVTQGNEYYKIDGVAQTLQSENFMIVHPGQEVEVHIDSSSSVEGTCYYLAPDLIHQIKYSNTRSTQDNLDNDIVKEEPIEVFDNIPIHGFKTLLNHYLGVIQMADLTKHQISEHLIFLAEDLVLHQDQTMARLNALDRTRSSTKQELYKRLQRGRQFIHDQFKDAITLNEMAKTAGLSTYYFHRNFRAFFKSTPYQYHNEIRMLKAKDMIQDGRNSKKEVAFACGFQDEKYFSKAFKKWAIKG